MINNYTKKSAHSIMWLKNGKGVARGIPSGARTKARNSWLVSLMMLFLLLVGDIATAQVSYTQAFTSNAGSWTGNFTQFTGTTACGGSGGAMRRNLYSSVPTGELISPNIGTSNGTTLQTITYAYKAAVWSANTVGQNPWGSFDVQYGSSASGPWTTIATVSQETQNGSCISKSHTFTPPAGNLFIRFSATRTAGDYYLNFDSVDVSFVPTTPPSCATALVPANGATFVARNATLSWTAAAGASSYDVYYSTTSPADFKANVLTNSYTVPVLLLANTTYYYKVIAKNINGEAVGCTEQTFTTGTNLNYCLPVTGYGCGDGDVIARVTLNTLDNNSGTGCPSDPVPGNQGLGQNGPGYSNYTNLSLYPTLTTTLQAGSSYGCTVYAGQYSEGYAAWIDYNDDGIFDNVTERIGFSSGQVSGSGSVGVLGSSATFPIILACNPPLGQHTLRVRAMFAINGSAVTPCGDNSYGEIEDYLVTISAADPCPKPTTLAAAGITTTGANLSWVLGCAETNWEVAVQEATILTPPASGVAVTSTTYAASGLAVGTDYVFYVRAACTPGTLYSAWAGPFAFTTLPNLPGCGTNVAPANGATNLSLDPGFVTVSWTAPAVTLTEGAAASYDVYGGTTSGSLSLLGNIVGTSADITGLPYNTTYFWRIVPRNASGVAVGPCTEWSFTTALPPVNDVCSGAIDLATLTSPLTSSTAGLADDYTPDCVSSTSPDKFYKINVAAGWTLNIGQVGNNYDSVHVLFYGTCALSTPISCTDEPDDQQQSWTNNTGQTQTVYWVQDGWLTNSGLFTLQWSLIPPPVVVTSFSPNFVCGQAGGETVTITGSNFVNVTSVKFYGIEATSFNVVNETTITAVVPAGDVSGPVSVTSTPSSNGMGTSAALFEARPFPTNYATTSNPAGIDAICGTDTISLENPGALGIWGSTNPSAATVLNGVVTGVNEGTTNITYTVTDNGCTSVANYPVTVSNPIINVTNPINVNAITGTPASFTTSATGTIVSYQWLVFINGDGPFVLSNGAVYSGVDTPTLSIPVTTEDMNNNEYFCLITGTSPCANVETGAAILKVGNTGIITNPSSVNLCNGGQAQFTVVPTGAVESYVWYEDNGFGFGDPIVNGGDFSGATTATLTVSNVTTTNRNGFSYYVVVNGPANSPESSVASINVSVPASITTSPSNQTVCYSGGSASFTAAASNALGYQWQFSTVGGANDSDWTTITAAAGPTGITYAGFNTATLGVTVTNAVSPAGTYFYRAIALSGTPCPNAKSGQAQLIINNPIVAIATPNGTVSCGGSAVTLNASGADGFVWSTGAATASISVSPASQTTYTVTGTTTGCAKQASVTVSVSNATSATASASATTVCPGQTVQLTAAGTQAYTTPAVNLYAFTHNPSPLPSLDPMTGSTQLVGSSSDDGASAVTNIGFTFNFAGNNYTQFSANANGVIRLGSSAVSTQWTNSTANIAATAPAILAYWDDLATGTNGKVHYKLTGTAPNRVLVVEWFVTVPRSTSGTAAAKFQARLYEGTNVIDYVYGPGMATNTANSGASIGLATSSTVYNSVAVATNTNSTSSFTTNNTAAIADGKVYRFAPGNTPTFTYAWTASNGSGTLTGANTANPVATPVAASTTYTVVVTSNTGCSDTKSVTVTVETGVNNFVQPVAQTFCAGQTATLSVSASGAGLLYSWYKVGNATPVGNAATLSIANATVANSGNYYVVVTPLCGSPLTSNTVALTINPLPTATVSGISACRNDAPTSVTFTGANGTAPYTFTYAINGVTQPTVTTVSGNSITLPVSTATTAIYTYALVSVQDANCSQAQSGIAVITINELPLAPVLSSDSPVCQGSDLNLSATVSALTYPILNQNFENGLAGWTITSGSTGGTNSAVANFNIRAHGWASGTTFNSPGGGSFILADPDAAGSGVAMNTQLTSPSFSTVGYSAATISFRHYHRYLTTAPSVQVSTDGGTNWVTLASYSSDQGTATNFTTAAVSLNAYLGLPNVKIRYNYTGGWLWYWGIDDISISGVSNTYAYSWSGPNGYSSSVQNATVSGATPAASGSYLLEITSIKGCKSSSTVETLVYPTPTVAAPANQVYYTGFTAPAIPLTGTPSGVTFNISGGAASGLADVNNVTEIPSFIPTATPSTVTITPVANGCVGIPGTYQILFNPVIVNIESNVCGSINNGLNNQINCTSISIPGYTTTGYQFEVTNTATGEVALVFSSQHHFKLTDSNNYAYGTTFTIRVAAVLNGQVQGYFGNTCSLTTASVQTSRVVTAQCGSTLLFVNSTINANSVSSTNLYRFRVALASAPTVTYLVERTVPNFKLTDVAGLPLLYNTEYLVDVQIRVKLAGFEAWSQYGLRCSVFTPASPETSLVASQCEDYLVPSSSSPINAIAFPGATAYRFRLTGYDEFGDVNYQQEVTNATASFTLSQFAGLTPGTTYVVAVAMELFGSFTDYTKDCTIVTPATAKHVIAEPFKATAYPNPFAANFMIDVKTSSDSVIAIKVYDMVGRLVEQKSVTVAQLENSPIGNNYPSGVYNVVVTQDDTVQTVRVVKR